MALTFNAFGRRPMPEERDPNGAAPLDAVRCRYTQKRCEGCGAADDFGEAASPRKMSGDESYIQEP
jgi:hypothetical protein